LDWQWPGRGEGELTAFDGPNFRLSKTPDSQWAPDTYGQHDHYILKEFLGMSDDEIADLFAEKVLTTEDDIVSLR
jgi:crotonobetainyl-CoA:carnitine CoA-transferase CaiB-like acyl-CoA transferase